MDMDMEPSQAPPSDTPIDDPIQGAEAGAEARAGAGGGLDAPPVVDPLTKVLSGDVAPVPSGVFVFGSGTAPTPAPPPLTTVKSSGAGAGSSSSGGGGGGGAGAGLASAGPQDAPNDPGEAEFSPEVQMMMGMGFPADAAKASLRRCDNNIEQALDFCIANTVRTCAHTHAP